MRAIRAGTPTIAALFVAVVLQTTLFGRIRIGGVAPDLVMLVVILSALRLRDDVVLLLGFSGGLLIDVLGSTAVGLRSLSFTIVAYLAIRWRDRAETGPLAAAVWAGGLTFVGVVLVVTIGSIFGQFSFSATEALRRVLIVPVLNTIVALLATPIVGRLLRPPTRGIL